MKMFRISDALLVSKTANSAEEAEKDSEVLRFDMPKIASRFDRSVDRVKEVVKIHTELTTEINLLWSTYDEKRIESIYSKLETVFALSDEPREVRRQHLPAIASELVKLHPLEEIRNLFPVENMWIPEGIEDSFLDVCANYGEDMTYLRHDYYNLITLGIALRPLIPIFVCCGAIRRLPNKTTIEDKRRHVSELLDAYHYIAASDYSDDVAILKLERYFIEAIPKIESEAPRSFNREASISAMAIFAGFGSEQLDSYFMSIALVAVMSISVLNPSEDLTNSARRSTVVNTIYRQVKTEVSSKLPSKLSDKSIMWQKRGAAVERYGEVGKVANTDVVQAADTAPLGAVVDAEQFFLDYRGAIRSAGLAVQPAVAKEFIVNMENNPPAYTCDLHRWLVASVFRCDVERKLLKLMSRSNSSPLFAMGLAQAELVTKGHPKLAALLSCTIVPDPNNIGLISMENINADFREQLDIYYPMRFDADSDRGRTDNEAIKNIDLIIKNWIERHKFIFKADELTATRMNIAFTEIDDYIPASSLRNDLAEWLIRTARANIEKVMRIRNLELNQL